MSGHFTDRDERMWQRQAEERAARPLPIGAWLKALRTPRPGPPRAVRPEWPERAPGSPRVRSSGRTPVPARPRPAEQA
ncbi:hypothetical protein R6L23_04780 [Streptomyces sp. SR27]|uniref:hypothetical protein n=1 Tax=unclassified Streptomyces TaxID=2593676 RepID=UPI00295BA5A7|nr:hypothetical protein [Streptomyces sp. SR27]MDV9187542.1 hypothetical protein [Streptomyces sp. SR27]